MIVFKMTTSLINKMKNDLPIEQAGRTRKSLKRWLIPLVVVLLVGAGGAVVAMRGGNKKVEAPKAAAAPAVMELANSDVVSVDARELRVQLPISGGLTALHQATVKSKVIGEVRETPVPEGVAVQIGRAHV